MMDLEALAAGPQEARKAHDLFPGVQYGVFELSDQDEMASLLAETFSRYDPPALAMGVTAEEFKPLVRRFGPGATAEGLTIVARSASPQP